MPCAAHRKERRLSLPEPLQAAQGLVWDQHCCFSLLRHGEPAPQLTPTASPAVWQCQLCEQGRAGGHVSGAIGRVQTMIPVGWLWALSLCMLLCSRTCDIVPMNSACSHGARFSGSL